jgi:hypothetical protein
MLYSMAVLIPRLKISFMKYRSRKRILKKESR